MTYLDPDMETASPDRLREVQFKRLRQVLEAVEKGNSFYRRRFQNHGVTSNDIRSLDDISKFPFSYKHEFQSDQAENPPFGTNLSEPLVNYVRYHQTSGTTGRPLKWLDTKKSWQWRIRLGALSLWAAGVRPDDIVFYAFSFGPHVAFWGLFEGAESIGAMVIAGGGWDTKQRLQSILENRATVLLCTPTYAIRMAEVAQEAGIDLGNSRIRLSMHAGEPGALVPGICQKIEQAWGCRSFDYPGLTEVGAYALHCEHQQQAIHVNESDFIIEVIDPLDERPVPEGEVGEMVLTNLGRSCSPGIRFRTGDLVRLVRTPCPCGRTFALLDGGVLGRSDDMITVRGMNLYPPGIAAVVEKHLIIGEEYQVLAYTLNNMSEVKVKVECKPERQGCNLARMIADELRQQFEIRIEVEEVGIGSLPREEFKSRRFVDLRGQ